MQDSNSRQAAIRLGTHGEDYGNWMPVSMLRLVRGLLALTVVLAVLSFTVFRLTVLGVIFVIAAAIFLVLLGWITWIRRQYAFGGGGMMERVHHTILSHLDYDGKGTLRLRRADHPGCPDVAVGKSNGHRLLGRGLRIRPGYVREKRRQ